MHRIQFDIDDEVYERAMPFIKSKKALSVFGFIAFEEWLKRREAREGRAITQDEAKIKKIVLEVLRDAKQ